MSLPQVVSRDEWVAARKALLVKEKELTRQRDALNAERRMLPMVKIDKDYVFEGPDGKVGLARPVRRPAPAHHRATSCSIRAGTTAARAARPAPTRSRDGLLDHLTRRDTSFAVVSARAAREDRGVQGEARAGRSRGTRRSAATSTTTSTSRSTSRSRRSSTTTAPRPSTRRVGEAALPESGESSREPGPQLLPARRRRRVPHVLGVRPRARARSAARTTSSTRPRSAARRTGRSRRVAVETAHPATPDFATDEGAATAM